MAVVLLSVGTLIGFGAVLLEPAAAQVSSVGGTPTRCEPNQSGTLQSPCWNPVPYDGMVPAGGAFVGENGQATFSVTRGLNDYVFPDGTKTNYTDYAWGFQGSTDTYYEDASLLYVSGCTPSDTSCTLKPFHHVHDHWVYYNVGEAHTLGLSSMISPPNPIAKPMVAKFTEKPAPRDQNPYRMAFDATAMVGPIDSTGFDWGGSVVYEWDFGQGSTGTPAFNFLFPNCDTIFRLCIGSRLAYHTYTAPGSYTVSLKATFTYPDIPQPKVKVVTSTFVTTVAVTPTPPPDADFIAKEVSDHSLDWTFDATPAAAAAGHSITAYTWDFGDKEVLSATLPTPITHTFKKSGTYKVNLTVTDDLGQKGTLTKSINVGAPEIVVNSIDDTANGKTSGQTCDTGNVVGTEPECTLRAAIQAANLRTDNSVEIKFAIPGDPTIVPLSPLPAVKDNIVLNGRSQSGGSVKLLGVAAGPTAGLRLNGKNSTVQGFTVSSFNGPGVLIDGAGGFNKVLGSVLGVATVASTDAGNTQGVVVDNSPSAVIGGTGDDGNIIAKNFPDSGYGPQNIGILAIGPGAKGITITGNNIGTNREGADLPNARGVVLDGVPNASATDNVIAEGLLVDDAKGSNPLLRIIDNRIGVNRAGTAHISNKRGGTGLQVLRGSDSVIQGNIIAGFSYDILLSEFDRGTFSGNQVGVSADGRPLPTTTDSVGIVTSGGSGSTFSNNTIAGHRDAELLVYGSHETANINVRGDAYLENRTQAQPIRGAFNTITQNQIGSLTNGGGIQRARLGLVIGGGERSATVTDNTILGSEFDDVEIIGGSGHTIAGNSIGATRSGQGGGAKQGLVVRGVADTTIGVTSPNFIGGVKTALVVSGGLEPNQQSPRSTRVTIANNTIGLSSSGSTARIDAGVAIADTSNSTFGPGNVVVNSAGTALSIKNAALLVTKNRVGVTADGASAGNGPGIDVTDGQVRLDANIIANNRSGVTTAGQGTTTITRNEIFAKRRTRNRRPNPGPDRTRSHRGGPGHEWLVVRERGLSSVAWPGRAARSKSSATTGAATPRGKSRSSRRHSPTPVQLWPSRWIGRQNLEGFTVTFTDPAGHTSAFTPMRARPP